MQPKQFFILTLLIATACSQAIKITDELDQLHSQKSGPPCGENPSCGEARSFQDENEFKDFLTWLKTVSGLPYFAPDIPLPELDLGLADGWFPSAQIPPSSDPTFEPDIPQAQFSSSSDPIPTPVPVPAPVPFPINDMPIPQPTSPDPTSPANDFSGTNNQVNNIDEADLLKTDGTYIYTISNNVLSIILAYPSNQAKVISKLNFKDFNPSALFLQGDYLAIFGTSQVTQQFTFIKIYDVSNRQNIYLLKQYQVSGVYFSGRKLENGFIYLVSTYYKLQQVGIPWFDFGFGQTNLNFSSIFWYPETSYRNPVALNIFSFNLKDPIKGKKNIVTVCSESDAVMYMSQQHIYLSTFDSFKGQTKIRKIFIDENYIRPFGDGDVQGTIKNQFSLDEYGQFLRVAATDQNLNSNSVYVLDYFLKPYGSLAGIAPNQKIYSCRFVERRLYLVTFRQIDPFFVISFKSHKRPQILGELKVTGFSNYLHPYDETTIIGLGRQADINGRQLGLKISVFDVSDVSQPKQSAKFEIQVLAENKPDQPNICRSEAHQHSLQSK